MCAYVLETVVCTPKEGKGARLRRMLESRKTYKLRQDGCVHSWIGESADDSGVLLVQTLYASMQDWQLISKKIVSVLDEQDGGVDSCLQGPPLVGLFDVAEDFLSQN